MCGRFTQAVSVDALQERFQFRFEGASPDPRYNVSPTQTILTVLNDGGRVGRFMRWGLIPAWAKDPAIGQRMINARAETVAEKPSFRTALTRRRCLILADGFYEWRRVNRDRIPMYITLKDRSPFAFAGLWDRWRSASGEAVYSCTIITCPPNDLMQSIHNRMPVILPRGAEGMWLDPDVQEPGSLVDLLQPYDAGEMLAYAVSGLVNAPKNDVAACIDPVG